MTYLKGMWKKATIQGLLALILVCVTSYLYVTGQPVPDSLISLASMALGFYFRSATSAAGVD